MKDRSVGSKVMVDRIFNAGQKEKGNQSAMGPKNRDGYKAPASKKMK